MTGHNEGTQAQKIRRTITRSKGAKG